MAKLGTGFELVVSDVISALDPKATVRQGDWVKGPDGRRELDVIVEGLVDGILRRVQIECRDYNPARRAIGIAQIDALESKHRDLGVDLSLLCSNSGFTDGAIRKAKRVGVGLVGVLREKDDRIRYRVFDEVFIRRIEIVPNSADISFDFVGEVPPQGGIAVTDIRYDGLAVFDWIKHRVMIYLGSNPVVRGSQHLSFRFKRSVAFAIPAGSVMAKGLRIKFDISGAWFSQRVEIDATCGLYDWVRKTVRIGPGGGTISFKDVKFGEGGTRVKCPPGFDPRKLKSFAEGEIFLDISDIGGMDLKGEMPDLDEFIEEGDLVSRRPDLPPENCFSDV